MDDWQLIQEYVEQKSESAFRLLVERYTNLVFSAALRQVGESQLAEEIAQTVFILLAQKADGFRRDIILPGWLFRTTHFVAKRAMRTEHRRQRRDMEAYQMQQLETSDAAWLRMAPCLDEALAQLGETERNAIILRYFQGKELRQVGLTLGISEEAARKRVTRSVERLRSFFADRGYSISASLIVTVLGAQSVNAAPVGLAGKLAATALTTGASAAFPLVVQVLNALRWAKFKTVGWAAISGIATLAVLVVVVFQTSATRKAEVIDADDEQVDSNALVVQTNSKTASPVTVEAAASIEQQSVLRFRVLAADTDEAVPGAKLNVNTVFGSKWKTRSDLMTDATGWCNVSYPPTITRLDVGVQSPGWGARFVTWRPASRDGVPAEYIMRVERLTNSLGGFLVDEAGVPVPGADLIVDFNGTGDASGREMPRERAGFVFAAPSFGKSDANGRWVCNVIPSDHKGFQLEAKHPYFATTTIASLEPMDPELPTEGEPMELFRQLRAGTLVTRMLKSFRLAGQVLTESGEPIAGAKISEGQQTAVYKTSGEGWFEVPNLEAGEWSFTVSAENFAPIRKTVVIEEEMKPVEIKLSAGAVLRLKTVDQDGAPVAGVTVGLEQWGEDRHVLDWEAKSDSEGRIEWHSAPSSSVLELYGKREGYCYTRNLEFEADGAEHIVEMRRSLKVQVRVVDAESGAPLHNFKAYPGYGTGSHNWERLATVTSQDGIAEVTFEENKLPWRVRVEAKGYAVGTSEPLPTNAIDQLEVALKSLSKSTAIRGVVLQASGEAASNADVALCTLDQERGAILVRHGLLDAREKTGVDGSFEFKADPAAHTVVVAHPSGFARVPVQKETAPLRIVLQPWGRIEGVVRLSERTGDLFVGLSDWASTQYDGGLGMDLSDYGAVVGANGKFVIESAPPGRFHLSLGHGGESPPTHQTGITIQAGQTVFVELGGSGGDVVGRLLSSDGVSIIDWKKQIAAQLIPLPIHRLATPADLTGDSLKFWEVDFWQSEGGHSRLSKGQSIPLLVQADGSFRGYNVVPGTYRMAVLAKPHNAASPTIASLHENIVIPEQTDEGSKIIFDLSDRILKPVTTRQR